MAIITNTTRSSDRIGNREELHNKVSLITPWDTPIYTLIEKSRCTTTHPEWIKDELADAAENAQEEGAEYEYEATVDPVRPGNYTQIFRKGVVVSGTQDATMNAGNQEKTPRQVLKRSREFKKDVEFAIVSPQASAKGNTRKLGGLPTWYVTNALRGANGSDGGFSTSSGLTVAPTDGTQRAFTKALLDQLLKSAYDAGAEAMHLVASSYVKLVFADQLTTSTNVQLRQPIMPGKMIKVSANVDQYIGPLGMVTFHPNRVQKTAATARNVHLIDPKMVEFCWYRPIMTETVAKTGDANKRVIIGEGTLKVGNEEGIGVIADVFGLTAST